MIIKLYIDLTVLCLKRLLTPSHVHYENINDNVNTLLIAIIIIYPLPRTLFIPKDKSLKWIYIETKMKTFAKD